MHGNLKKNVELKRFKKKLKVLHQNYVSAFLTYLYRHPRPNAKTFLDKLSKKLESYSLKNTSFLLMGDINIDVRNSKSGMSNKYLEMLSSVGFENLEQIPTRYGSSSKTILDHYYYY